jgi:hypothetical protein
MDSNQCGGAISGGRGEREKKKIFRNSGTTQSWYMYRVFN